MSAGRRRFVSKITEKAKKAQQLPAAAPESPHLCRPLSSCDWRTPSYGCPITNGLQLPIQLHPAGSNQIQQHNKTMNKYLMRPFLSVSSQCSSTLGLHDQSGPSTTHVLSLIFSQEHV